MTDPASRPLPTPSDLTRPFWEAAARRTLVRPLCDACGQSFFSPQIACPSCLSESSTWAESAGSGEIYSFTVCHRPPGPGFEVPYVLALVDLDECWSMLSNIVGCQPAAVRIGARVRSAWLELDEGIVLPVFELDPA